MVNTHFLSMDKFFQGKNKQDIIFIFISLFLLAILVLYIIFSASSLVRDVHQGINLDVIKNDEVIRFNFDQLEQLKKR